MTSSRKISSIDFFDVVVWIKIEKFKADVTRNERNLSFYDAFADRFEDENATFQSDMTLY